MAEKYTYRMSSCGHCPKRLGYERLGYEPLPTPDWLESSAEEGHWHEERIIGELEQGELELPKYGKIYWVVRDQQMEQMLEYPTFVLKGHIEGIATPYDFYCKDRSNLLEIKSMSPFEFDRWMKGKWTEFPAYACQLTAYMEATGLKEALYIVKNRSSGEKDRQIITAPPANFDNIVQKLTQVESLAQTEELALAEFDPDNWECKRCEYRQHCMPPLPVLAEDQEKALFEATEKWRRGKILTTEGYKLQEDAKLVLRGYTELTPTQKLIFNGIMTRIYAVHTLTYPKEDIEKLLSPDILAKIAKITDRRDCRVEDLTKTNKETQ